MSARQRSRATVGPSAWVGTLELKCSGPSTWGGGSNGQGSRRMGGKLVLWGQHVRGPVVLGAGERAGGGPGGAPCAGGRVVAGWHQAVRSRYCLCDGVALHRKTCAGVDVYVVLVCIIRGKRERLLVSTARSCGRAPSQFHSAGEPA